MSEDVKLFATFFNKSETSDNVHGPVPRKLVEEANMYAKSMYEDGMGLNPEDQLQLSVLIRATENARRDAIVDLHENERNIDRSGRGAGRPLTGARKRVKREVSVDPITLQTIRDADLLPGRILDDVAELLRSGAAKSEVLRRLRQKV